MSTTYTFNVTEKREVVVEETVVEKTLTLPCYMKSDFFESGKEYVRVDEDFNVVIISVDHDKVETINFDKWYDIEVTYLSLQDYDKLSNKEEFEYYLDKAKGILG
jgi:hypothetical protein